jgi:hypothetical protein
MHGWFCAAHVEAQSAPPGRPASPNATFSASETRRLLWMRAAEPSHTTLELRVERALGRTLAERGFVLSMSPMPFREAQLASGCVGGVPECGARVASALDSEQLGVSAFEAEPDSNTARLTLYLFEARGLVRTGSAVLPREPAEELELTVRALSESVFGVLAAPPRALATSAPDPRPAPALLSEAAPAQAAPRDAAEERAGGANPVLRGVGWAAVGVGVAGGIGAVASAVSAQSEKSAYARTKVETADDADAALRHYDKAQRRTEAARVLGGVGGGLLAAGMFMLLWERFAEPRDRKLQPSIARRAGSLQIALSPQQTGAWVGWGTEM